MSQSAQYLLCKHVFGIFGKLCSTGLLNMIFQINLKVILTLNVNLSSIRILMTEVSILGASVSAAFLSSPDTTLAVVYSKTLELP